MVRDMISVHGTYQHGAVVLDEPVTLPEGAHVRVTLATDEATRMDGRPWPLTPAEIEAYIAEMDATPGLDLSDEENASLEADRLAGKAQGREEAAARIDRTARLFA